MKGIDLAAGMEGDNDYKGYTDSHGRTKQSDSTRTTTYDVIHGNSKSRTGWAMNRHGHGKSQNNILLMAEGIHPTFPLTTCLLSTGFPVLAAEDHFIRTIYLKMSAAKYEGIMHQPQKGVAHHPSIVR